MAMDNPGHPVVEPSALDPRVLAAIQAAVTTVNEHRAPQDALSPELGTVLFGADGQLDSLELVELVAEVEAQLEDRFDLSIVLASERALSQRRSPFRTIGALAAFATTLAGELPVRDR